MTLEELATDTEELANLQAAGFAGQSAVVGADLSVAMRLIAHLARELQATRGELEDVKRRIATKATTF